MYYQKFFLWAPNTNVFSDAQGNYLYTDYGCTNLFAKYRYNEAANSIEILGNLGGGEVLSAQYYRSTQVMKVRFTQSYYTTKWETLTINGTYKRRL